MTKIIYQETQSQRVDKYLSTYFHDQTRSYIQKQIKDGDVSVNNKVIKANYKLSYNDEITIEERKPIIPDIIPEDLPLDIVFEDEYMLVVNKPAGMVVHPAPGNYSHTLVNAIMYHCKDRLSSINGVARPGIVHRIDKDTSGLLMICKTDMAHQKIAAALKEHTIHRVYHALVYNSIKEDFGTIDAPIGRSHNDRKKMSVHATVSKSAITHYRVLERLDGNKYTYVELKLETGRTHQIRVHMASIGNPLIGDPFYGPKKAHFVAEGQMLHAKEIGFIHPYSEKYMEFSIEPPEKFQHILTILRKKL